MKKDLAAAVRAFKNANRTAATEINKFMASLARRIASHTKELEAAAREELVQVKRQRYYYPVRRRWRSRILRFRRGSRPSRRKAKKRKGKCPCFSKARYRTGTVKTRWLKPKMGGFNGVGVGRRRSTRRRRRGYRRLTVDDVERVEAAIIEARRRRSRALRRRRRARSRVIGEDTTRKGKEISKQNRNGLIKTSIKVENKHDAVFTNDHEESEVNEKNRSEEETDDNSQIEDQYQNQSKEKNQTEEEKSNTQSISRSKLENESGSREDNREEQNQIQNQKESESHGSEAHVTSSSAYDPPEDMDIDDCEYEDLNG